MHLVLTFIKDLDASAFWTVCMRRNLNCFFERNLMLTYSKYSLWNFLVLFVLEFRILQKMNCCIVKDQQMHH
jgi:hypothetical protein